MAAARFGRYDAGVLLGSGIYLYFKLFSFGGTPFLLGGDEQVFWMNALRMPHGELPYRDFFEFTPPGADLVYFSAFSLLGPRVWVPNVVQLVLGITLSWLCFHIARSITKPAPAALAAALFITLDFGKWMDATHHWFNCNCCFRSCSCGGSSAAISFSRWASRDCYRGTRPDPVRLAHGGLGRANARIRPVRALSSDLACSPIRMRSGS